MKEPTGIINNVEFGKAWDLFLEATDNFLGNKEKGIPGAHPTYMAALESEAEELDTLYEEVLAARAAVEEAYENMAVNYQAETAAYEALSEDDRLAPYGKTTAAEIHKTIEESYTGYGTEAYNSVCDSEIPAPPQKEDPEPTTPPSGDDTPGTTDKPGTDTPVTPDEPGNSGTSNSPASAPDYYSNSMQSVVQTIAAAENLYLEYTYNGKDYKVLIPAGKAFLIEGIEYYGPLYLYSLFPYDGQDANSNTDALDYTIVKGDTLSKIAKRNNTTVSELLKLNKIKNPNRIRTGQKIVLPAK